jgi:DNA protecting protein DprA
MSQEILKKNFDCINDSYWQRLKILGSPFDQAQSILVRSDSQWPGTASLPKIAIVGTRRPTSYGMRFVSEFIKLLAEHTSNEAMVVSGGALGIDAWAHECSLRNGLVTEAWVVGPIKRPNPRSNHILFQAIMAKNGALICPASLEPLPGCSPYKSDWIMRNAYLVARADAVIVPEANEKSGTWSSVRWAGKIGIPVFALPGPVDQGASSGTNSMISNGYAHPIQSATKLIEDLVVEGVLDPYNGTRDKGLALSQSHGAEGLQKLEARLCAPGGIQVVDLPGLSEQMGLKLAELCEYLLNEIQEGKLHRVGNGFERRG